jgi:Invasion associated locus B (IalB) protein
MKSVLRSTLGLLLLLIAALALAPMADAQQPAPAAPAAAPKPKKPPRPKPDQKSDQKPDQKPEQAAAPAPPAAAEGAQPTLLGMFGEWGAYTASPGGKKICFALAKPSKSETTPPNRPRDPAFLFISSRPAEKVKDEVSLIIGYGFKPNTDATLELAGASYAMYTQNDGAWIKNAAEEAKLIDAMRKGGDLAIKGTSARGTGTLDVFSLKGLAQALDKVGEECR